VEQWCRPLPEVALQFVLAIEGISVGLAGIRTEAHLRDNVRYVQGPPLTDQQLQALRRHRAA
jgi:aryl-alcohol dehydrogenase-like predicted oxidoreductase